MQRVRTATVIVIALLGGLQCLIAPVGFAADGESGEAGWPTKAWPVSTPEEQLSNAHIFFGLRSLVETDSLVGVGLSEGGFMSMEVGLGRFGDRRLEKGGRRCMRPSFDVQAPAFDALQGTGPRRFGSRVFCAMKG